MSTRSQRAMSLILAIVFLVSTLGLVGVIVVQTNQQEDQQAALQASLSQNQEEKKVQTRSLENFTPVADVPELRYEDQVVGTGKEVTDLETPLTFHYSGVLAVNNVGFDSSVDRGQPITYPLSQLIPGWQKGIPGMKEGGKRRLYIPSDLGYGGANSPGIPPNSDLVFDIELIKVGQ